MAAFAKSWRTSMPSALAVLRLMTNSYLVVLADEVIE
jgi:hypothetical protein